MERGRVLRRPHFLSNANTALQFLASKKIKLVNINPADLVDGRPPVVLGLIWTIILYFQVSTRASKILQKLRQKYFHFEYSIHSIFVEKHVGELSNQNNFNTVDYMANILTYSNIAILRKIYFKNSDFQNTSSLNN